MPGFGSTGPSTARGTIFSGPAVTLDHGWRAILGRATNGPHAGRWFAILAHYPSVQAPRGWSHWIEDGPFETRGEADEALAFLRRQQFGTKDDVHRSTSAGGGPRPGGAGEEERGACATP